MVTAALVNLGTNKTTPHAKTYICKHIKPKHERLYRLLPVPYKNLPDFQLQDKAKRFYMYNVKVFYPQRCKGTYFSAFNKRLMGVIF